MGTLAAHPLDVLRTRQATNGLSLACTVRQVWSSSNGIIGFYSGVISPCVSVGAWKAVVLGTHKALLSGRGAEPKLRDVLASSAAAGVTGAVVVGPVDLIKTRAMTIPDVHTRFTGAGASGGVGLWSVLEKELTALRSVSKPELARSITILAARDLAGTPVFLGSYEVLFRMIRRRRANDSGPQISAGLASIIAGPSGWLACYPIEMYRIHQQSSAQGSTGIASNAEGFGQWLRRLHADGGHRGWATVGRLYRGFPCRAVGSSLQIAVTMVVFESIRARAEF